MVRRASQTSVAVNTPSITPSSFSGQPYCTISLRLSWVRCCIGLCDSLSLKEQRWYRTTYRGRYYQGVRWLELPSSTTLQISWLAGQGQNHRPSTLPIFSPHRRAARCQLSLERPFSGRISLFLLCVYSLDRRRSENQKSGLLNCGVRRSH